jgi:hypothetical protein
MSLDKAIKHGKEKRKPYRGSKAIDATCRNHGSCTYCRDNRTHKFKDKDAKSFAEELTDMILFHQTVRENRIKGLESMD